MQYIVERDLFMSKLQNYLNDKTAEGYTLVNMFVSEEDIREGREYRDGDERRYKYTRASKVTVIMKK